MEDDGQVLLLMSGGELGENGRTFLVELDAYHRLGFALAEVHAHFGAFGFEVLAGENGGVHLLGGQGSRRWGGTGCGGCGQGLGCLNGGLRSDRWSQSGRFLAGCAAVGSFDYRAWLQVGVACINEFQEAGLTDGADGQLWVFDARQLDDDPSLALKLDQRLGYAQAVNAVLDDDLCRAQGVGVYSLPLGHVRLEEYLETTLQVQTLVNFDLAVNVDRPHVQVDARIGRPVYPASQ